MVAEANRFIAGWVTYYTNRPGFRLSADSQNRQSTLA
jgi:hypothetical protein